MKNLTYTMAATLLFLPSPAFAEEDPFTLLEKNVQIAKSFRVDLNTPTSPGFAVINASPKKVSEPGSLQELVIDSAGFVENGTFKPGFAVNFQPFWLLGGDDVTLEQYSGQFLTGETNPDGFSPMQRILARTQVSVASVQGENPTSKTGTRYGFGLHTQLLDGSDPRDIAAAKCIIDAWDLHAQPITDDLALRLSRLVNTDAQLEELAAKEIAKLKTPAYDKAYEACQTAAELRFLQARSWMVGAGVASSSSTGNFDSIDYSGASFWTTFKQPYGTNKSVILFGKADFDRRFQAGNGSLVTGNSYHAAVSLALQELTWKMDATASYHFNDAHSSAFTDDYLQFAVNGSYKMREGIWLEGSFGTRTGSGVEDDSFGLVQLKFDLGKSAQDLLN